MILINLRKMEYVLSVPYNVKNVKVQIYALVVLKESIYKKMIVLIAH